MSSTHFNDVFYGEGVTADFAGGQMRMRSTDVTPSVDSKQFSMFCDEYSGELVCPQFKFNDGVGDRTVKLYRADAISDPSGGTTIDAEARAAIQSILNHLRNLGLVKS